MICDCKKGEDISGRNDQTWTGDLYHPKIVRYQAALRPELKWHFSKIYFRDDLRVTFFCKAFKFCEFERFGKIVALNIIYSNAFECFKLLVTLHTFGSSG